MALTPGVIRTLICFSRFQGLQFWTHSKFHTVVRQDVYHASSEKSVWQTLDIQCIIYIYISIYPHCILLYPHKWLLWLFSPHIETHPFIHITANHLRTVSCTLLESRLCDLQRFHSSLWVSWLCSSAEVGSRHPETMLIAVETLTSLIFSQFGGYICTFLHTLYVCIVPVIPKR